MFSLEVTTLIIML